ncbi:interferon-induced protein 44-like [Engraulis encrasicolus]|uniref:interferon-induced protein 44-like n=1 Tax=Engraulis encrasicolus TaxID=184585 RepID=UPI002FD3D5D8
MCEDVLSHLIFFSPPDQSVKRGATITLTWKSDRGAYGTWRKDGQLVTGGGKDSRLTIRHEDDKKFFLTIVDVREEDEGQYSLELENWLGKETGSANVKLLEYDLDWRSLEWNANEKRKKKLENFTLSNPQIGHLRFLLHGPVGYGKSSIINSFNSVFQRRITEKALTATATDTSHTKVYKTYQVKDAQGRTLPFVFNDSMGLENAEGGGSLTDDIIAAIQGHVKEDYEFKNNSSLCEGDDYYNHSPNLSDQVHCLITVIHGSKITLMQDSDNILKKMRTIRRAASDLGIPQVVIMTHVDECCKLVKTDLKHIYSSKKIHNTMDHCSKKLGVPMKCIFPVKNYHEENTVDPKTDCLILQALQSIALLANDYVEDKK